MLKFILILPFFLDLSFAESLSLKDYIEQSLKTDKKFEQFELEKQKKDYIIDQGLPADALTLSLEHEVGKVSNSDTDNVSTTGSLTKDFSLSGTSLSVQQTHSERPNIEENTTEVTIEQSLTKNAFGRDSRLLKTQLQEESKLLVDQANEDKEEYYLEALTLYFEYQAAFDNYELALQIKKDTDRLTTQVKNKFKKQIASKTDKDKALIEQIDAESDLLEKEKDLNIIKSKIYEKVGKSKGEMKPEKADIVFKAFKSIHLAEINVYKTRDYKISEMSEKISKMQMELTEREDALDISLVAGYATEDSTRYSAPVKQDQALIGVKLSVPFGDDQTKANAQIARLEYRKNKLEKERLEKELERQIQNIKTQIQYYEKNLVLLKAKVSLSKSVLDDETKRYLIGKIDLDTLLQRKSEYATNRFTYQETLTTYLMLSTQWMEFNDELDVFISKLFS